MAKKVRVDFTGVESFTKVSEGVHPAKIVKVEETTTQGGNDAIKATFEVTKGGDKGNRVIEVFPLTDTALWKLKGMLQAIGMKAEGKVQIDLDRLVGKTCKVSVIHEEYNGSYRAKVDEFLKLSANTDDDDEDMEDEDEDIDEDGDEEEEKPKKKAKKAPAKKKPAKKKPVEDDDEDEDDDDESEDEDDDEEEEEKPKKKPATKKKAPAKKAPAKKSKKKVEEPEDDDDEDWDDDDDEDWEDED